MSFLKIKSNLFKGYLKEDGNIYPLRGRQCSSEQMPFINEKFRTYHEYAQANIKDVYGEKLNEGIEREVNNFASGLFWNKNGESFDFSAFPNAAQLSSINKIIPLGSKDQNIIPFVLVGNMYGSEVETPRNDASYGTYLEYKNGQFIPYLAYQSGLYADGDIKDASLISLTLDGKAQQAIILVKNYDKPQVVLINN